MKYVLVAAAWLAASAALACGQDGGAKIAHLTQALQLDASQVAQVDQILSAARERKVALRESGSEDWRSDMQAIHAEVLEQLRGVLTEEQLAKFQAMHEAHKGLHHGPHTTAGAEETV